VNPSSTLKTIMFWLFIIMLGVLLWTLVSKSGQSTREKEPSYSEFMADVDRGNVKEVELYLSPTSYEVQGEKREPAEKFRVTIFKESAPDLVKTLRDKNVLINVKEVNRADWVSVLFSAAPILLLVAFWIFMMRQMQAGGNKALSFGKSRARLLTAQQKKATFKDVAGTDEAKEELQEIIEFLKDPQKFQKLGGRIPKGVLLVGPPGTGKTLLARAIAGEANVPFFSISGSDFVEMFVGVGASRVRDLFEQGKKNAPCIIFIDEIDAVGRHRRRRRRPPGDAHHVGDTELFQTGLVELVLGHEGGRDVEQLRGGRGQPERLLTDDRDQRSPRRRQPRGRPGRRRVGAQRRMGRVAAHQLGQHVGDPLRGRRQPGRIELHRYNFPSRSRAAARSASVGMPAKSSVAMPACSHWRRTATCP